MQFENNRHILPLKLSCALSFSLLCGCTPTVDPNAAVTDPNAVIDQSMQTVSKMTEQLSHLPSSVTSKMPPLLQGFMSSSPQTTCPTSISVDKSAQVFNDQDNHYNPSKYSLTEVDCTPPVANSTYPLTVKITYTGNSYYDPTPVSVACGVQKKGTNNITSQQRTQIPVSREKGQYEGSFSFNGAGYAAGDSIICWFPDAKSNNDDNNSGYNGNYNSGNNNNYNTNSRNDNQNNKYSILQPIP